MTFFKITRQQAIWGVLAISLLVVAVVVTNTLWADFSPTLTQPDPLMNGGQYIQTNYVIASGGTSGDGISSTNYRMMSTLGQPSDTTTAASSNYILYSGYWGPLIPSSGNVYLPTVLNNVSNCYVGPLEIEPNNTRAEATGPLCDAQTYQGAANDQKDYFTFVTNSSGNIVIDLTGHAGTGVQMQLFYQNETTPRAFDTDPGPNFHITYNGPTGQYYIYIFTDSGYSTTPLYNLTVNYP